MTIAKIIIPAGTICEVAGMPLKFQADTTVEGEPEEVALLHTRLYSLPAHGLPGTPAPLSANDLTRYAMKVAGYLGSAYDGEPSQIITALVAEVAALRAHGVAIPQPGQEK
jgi:hypothetical protein